LVYTIYPKKIFILKNLFKRVWPIVMAAMIIKI
jgi:hypothetical protein